MKNQLLFALLIISLSFPVYAQTQSRATFGFVGGISQTWHIDLEASGTPHALKLPGFSIGALMNLPLTETIRFQPELAYVRRTTGYTYEKSGSFSSYSAKTTAKESYSFDMIQVPIWFQFGRQTYVGVGVAYGFPIRVWGSNDITTTSNSSPPQHTNETFSADFDYAFQSKVVDVGISVGRRLGSFGWEIRPSVSFDYNKHFWNSPSEATTFQISGLITWLK